MVCMGGGGGYVVVLARAEHLGKRIFHLVPTGAPKTDQGFHGGACRAKKYYLQAWRPCLPQLTNCSVSKHAIGMNSLRS